MSRLHYMQDRVQITSRIPKIDRGLIENVSRGLVEDEPDEYPVDRTTDNRWIPARLRLPAGDEAVTEMGSKIDLAVIYELVMYAWDENGEEICPGQDDELILKYRRDGGLVDTTSRLRITGTIRETRKRNKLYSYVMPVVMDTEF